MLAIEGQGDRFDSVELEEGGLARDGVRLDRVVEEEPGFDALWIADKSKQFAAWCELAFGATLL
jgi:hypothetical protein